MPSLSPDNETLTRRGRTALKRSAASRPIRLALEHQLLRCEDEILDYGCGHGGDVQFLKAADYRVRGFDPVHGPFLPPTIADVVNLGYVVNVIESPLERREVLDRAWSLARRLLVVSARLESEARTELAVPSGDGLVTRIGTFQRLYTHAELGAWVRSILQHRTEALGPGVFAVFRDPADADRLDAQRFRRVYLPKIDHRAAFISQHGDLVERVLAFAAERGRLPVPTELTDRAHWDQAFGSAQRGLAAVRRFVDEASWAEAERKRCEDLIITIALSRFGRRPRLGQLPAEIKADVRAFFTSYDAACVLADELLFAIGNAEVIRRACKQSKVGKVTPKALYVHRDALHHLTPVLRLYEGCASAWAGRIDGEIVKLHYDSPAVSYLSYPDFDNDPHPRLKSSTCLDLQQQGMREQSYDMRLAAPILHRKEQFLAPGDVRIDKFARLTRQEEAAGLYADTTRIGLSTYWQALLLERGVELRGHSLRRIGVGECCQNVKKERPVRSTTRDV